jgi:tRNA threonylcarbamoyl adenosine modification protein (Sua5/YciO/YrdC/YwlC family)
VSSFDAESPAAEVSTAPVVAGPGDTGDGWSTAAEALRDGQVVVVPTDTVYGVGVGAWDAVALDRLFRLKGRDRGKPVAVLVADLDQAERIGRFDAVSRRLAERFWPGALTIVLARQPAFTSRLGGDRTSVGLRCPHHPALVALLAEVGPLAVTSANRSGRPTPSTAAEAAAELDGEVAVVVDGGTLAGVASTVVDCSGPFPEVLREGPVSREQIRTAIADLL